MISPRQCAAARACLGWDRAELAAEASITAETIRRFELGHKVNEGTVRLIEMAFAAANVQFGLTEDGHEYTRWGSKPVLETSPEGCEVV